MDSKAEYSALSSTRSQKKKLKQTTPVKWPFNTVQVKIVREGSPEDGTEIWVAWRRPCSLWMYFSPITLHSKRIVQAKFEICSYIRFEDTWKLLL